MSTTPIFNELAEASGLEFDEDGTLAAANAPAEPIVEDADNTAGDSTAERAERRAEDAAENGAETPEGTPAKPMQTAAS